MLNETLAFDNGSEMPLDRLRRGCAVDYVDVLRRIAANTNNRD